MTVCKYFMQGKCNFGDRCKFEHPRDYGGGGLTRTINNDDYGSVNTRRFGSREGPSNESNYNRPSLANRLGGGGGGDGFVSDYGQRPRQSPVGGYIDDMSVDGIRPTTNTGENFGHSSVHDRLGPRRGGAYNNNNHYPSQSFRPRHPHYDNYNDGPPDNNNYYNRSRGGYHNNDYRQRFPGRGGAGDGPYNNNRPAYDNRQQQHQQQPPRVPSRQPFDSFGNAASTPDDLCRIVGDDITDWNSSKTMWPLSSYAFAWSDAATSSRQNVPIFGFTDISPEEVRFAYKEAYTSVVPSSGGPSVPLGAAELQREAQKLPPDVQQKLLEVMKQYETGVSNEVHRSNVIKEEILRRLKANAVDPDIVKEVKQGQQ